MKISFLTACLVMAGAACSLYPGDPPAIPAVQFEEQTGARGIQGLSCTFGAVFSDIDNDGDDDLVISNHGCAFPLVYLNQDGFFQDRSALLPVNRISDRHHIGLLDLDNDGDKDLVIACGGDNGIGPGWPNEVYRNMLREQGTLAFIDIGRQVDIGYPLWRGRTLLPLAGTGGQKIDLYFTCKPRAGITNIYLKNSSDSQGIRFTPDESPGLNLPLDCEGNDIFFDLDRDGDRDLMVIDKASPYIYINENGRFTKNDRLSPKVGNIFSASVGDLDNDGYPDLFFGRWAANSDSDRVSFNGQELHFCLYNKGDDQMDIIDFRTKDGEFWANFFANISLDTDNTSDIYLGSEKKHPASRKGNISTADLLGKPVLDKPGIYLWKDTTGDQWHLACVFGGKKSMEVGRFRFKRIYDVRPQALESFPITRITDVIVMNNRGKAFEPARKINPYHDKKTRSASLVDVNNDGRLDIVGVRGSERGDFNGQPFVLINRGSNGEELILEEQENTGLSSQVSKISQANYMTYGFVDSDGLPDLFVVNGFGLPPDSYGPYQLFINRTVTAFHYTILELEGTTCNRDALGAQVELYDKDGVRLGYRELGADYSGVQRTHKLHFGLGPYTGVLKAKILWPDKRVQEVIVKPDTVNIIKQAQ